MTSPINRRVTSSGSPIPFARIEIYEAVEGGRHIKRLLTDKNGMLPQVTLEAPTAYDKGGDAFLAGAERYQNPHEQGSDTHQQWDAGWQDEQDDSERPKEP